MKLLQINVTANSGSTGRIAEGIGKVAQSFGFESWLAYGRHKNQSTSHLIQIGSIWGCYEHGLESRILDNHGLASRHSTESLLKKIDTINPDVIHLHNIHGYFLNYKSLFQYLSKKNIPIIWTLHDCWPFTGHCAYFSFCGCRKWITECHNCPQISTYPKSIILDRSKSNFINKKKSFSSVSNLNIISVSHWLDNLVSQSFLGSYKHQVIHNGIDTNIFSPEVKQKGLRVCLGIPQETTVLLGVASVWSERKGLRDFIELSKQLSPHYKIILIGLTSKQIKKLPSNIIGIKRTESTQQLADYYSMSDLFLNLTYEENYPSTNLEAISCGTPCLTYHTGGSAESVTPETGFIVSQGDLSAVLQCVETIRKYGKKIYTIPCRNYALSHFRQEDCFKRYIELYKELHNKQ